MFDLITIGDATFDTFLVLDEHSKQVRLHRKKNELALNYADKIYINDTHQSLGGNATNMAVGATKLGHNVGIVTELGDDLTGHIIRDELDHQGVNTSLITQHKGKSSRFSMVLNYLSERTILSYHASRNYTLPDLPDTKWLYYTSLGHSFPLLQKKLLRHIRNHSDLQVAMNPGSYQLHYPDILRQMLPYVDLLFVNKEEAAIISGKKGSIKSQGRYLHELGANIVVITDSSRGSYCSSLETGMLYHMAPYPIDPIAKTGAGDAYASGFLSAIIHGESITTAMQWGTANASGVIETFGAQKGLLSQTDIIKRIKTYKNIVPRKV